MSSDLLSLISTLMSSFGLGLILGYLLRIFTRAAGKIR